MKKLALLFALIGASFVAFATHDVGGNISYEFLGDTDGDGDFNYNITLTTYQDCGSPFWWTTGNGNFPLSSQTIGVYEGFDTSSVLNILQTVTLTLNTSDSSEITVELPSGCPAPSVSVCVYEVIYRGTVDLPLTLQGYHFVFDKCCRNVMTNINSPQFPNPNGSGVVYHAWTSGPLSGNSSPVFADLSVPFICTADTTPILNTASDPDGDQLLFSFEHPYDGNATNSGTQPPATINWPPTLVSYNSGFNVNQPFGSTGYAFINAFTGYTEYFAPNSGSYGVTVQIKELNGNGDLVGLSRRHYQFQALNGCQPNVRPRLSTIGSSGQTTYDIEEGDSLCFDITFQDPDGDSLNFSTNVSGDIFNSQLTNPAATVTPFTFGDSTATAEFCWNTGCNTGRSLPYQFSTTVKDAGCFPKEKAAVYQITVNNFEGPDQISGPLNVCSGEAGVEYTTDSIGGASYVWTIIGGTQISGGNSHRVRVNWGNGPGGTVLVSATSKNGCPSDPLDLPITVRTVVFDVGNDTTICFGDTATLGGSPTAPAGFSIRWAPAASLSNDTVQNPLAFPTTTTTYVLFVEDTTGCIVVDSVTVTIATNPNATAGPDTTICIGDIINLSASGGTSYSWSPSTGLSSTTIPNPQVNISATQTYVVTITDGSPCPTVDSVTVSVFNPAIVDAGNDTSFCIGNSLVLGGNPTGQAGSNFLWTPATDLSSDTVANPIFTPSSPGNYRFIVNVTAGTGCGTRDTVDITVHGLPSVSINPGRTVICEDDTTALVASGALNYLWSPINTLSDSIGTGVTARPTDTTLYSVVGTDGNGCVNTDSVLISVVALPEIETDSLLFLCAGDTVQFNSTVGVGITYSWSSLPVVNFISATNISDPFVSHNTAGDTIIFQLIINKTLVANCLNRDTTVLIIDSMVPTFAGPDTFLCAPGSVVLGGNPTGFAGTVFAWTNHFIDDSTLANPTVSPSGAFTYVVNTINGRCIGTDTVNVNVKPRPSIDVTPDSSFFCIGGSVQLNSTVTAGTIQSLSWFPTDSLTDPTIANPIASPDDTTFYVLTALDTNGCTDQDTAAVFVFTTPPINIFDTTICEGDSVQYVNSGAFNYLWSPNQDISSATASSPFVFPTTTRQYHVEVSNNAGCFGEDSAVVTVIPQPVMTITPDTAICIGDRITLNATGGNSILWSPFTGLSNPISYSPLANPTITTTYTATVTDGVCSASRDVTITVNPIPTIDAGPNDAACFGAQFQLAATGGSTYLWMPGNVLNDSTSASPIANIVNTTTFYVTGFDNIGCSNIDSITLTVNPLPVADAGPDRTVCEIGQTVSLGGSPTTVGSNTIIWSNGQFLDNPLSPNPLATVLNRQEFLLVVTDSLGCQNVDTVVVDIFAIALTPIADLCIGASSTLTFETLIGTEPFLFDWTPATGLDQTDIREPTSTPPFPIEYQVVVRDSNGCIDSATVGVFHKVTPEASFDLEVLADCDSAFVTVENTSVSADDYIWIYNGQMVDEERPEFLVPYSSQFVMQLVAINDICTDTAIVTDDILTFEDYYTLNPPNVFTPNGDGVNDLFEINAGHRLFNCSEVHIYNRWGQLMFKSAGPQHVWDGRTFTGQQATEGVYFYTVNVNGQQMGGSVTLMR